MKTAEIADRFLRYFEKRGHTIVPSASLVTDDPDAAVHRRGHGAVHPVPPRRRAPAVRARRDVQKCVRTPDIEEVGKTTRHGTFFQMLRQLLLRRLLQGRRDHLAWELLTELRGGRRPRLRPEGPLGHRLRGRRRGAGSGEKIAGLPDERIQRLGKDNNYWRMGVPGPGGPCSEIFYDRGPDVRRRRRTRRRRRPLPGDLEPRLHAVRARRRRARKDDFRHRRRAAEARTSTPAWASSGSPSSCRASRTCTRSTRCARCIDQAAELTGRRYGADHERRRAVARHRRPRPLLADADRRRRHPRQRGPRLRPAPPACAARIRSMRLLGVRRAVAARAVRRVAATR